MKKTRKVGQEDVMFQKKGVKCQRGAQEEHVFRSVPWSSLVTMGSSSSALTAEAMSKWAGRQQKELSAMAVQNEWL
jgi:hypothetical protein